MDTNRDSTADSAGGPSREPAGRATLSPERMRRVVVELSRADQARLEGVAQLYAYRCHAEPDDLLQEAVLKALAGERRCPVETAPVVFLSNAMRSIAHNWGKQAGRLVDLESVPLPAAPVVRLSTLRDKPSVPPLFPDDPVAGKVLRLIGDGLRGQALREEAGLGVTELATVRRRIRRRLQDPRVRKRPRSETMLRAESPGEAAPEAPPPPQRRAGVPLHGGLWRALGRPNPTVTQLDLVLDAFVEDAVGISEAEALAEWQERRARTEWRERRTRTARLGRWLRRLFRRPTRRFAP